jgi:hypothetical protein
MALTLDTLVINSITLTLLTATFRLNCIYISTWKSCTFYLYQRAYSA